VSETRHEASFDRARLRQGVVALASRGVMIGTSSWKYPGWRGMLYDDDRYIWRGKFSEARFERSCLAEYAEVFKTVCVDAAYYRFPDERYLRGLVSQVPEDFQFTFKVTDDITIRRFTNLPRFGARAGKPNENFLNADLFTSAFLAPCEPFRRNIGLLVFEFSRFYPEDFARGRDFVGALDTFLGRLPGGWPYAVELRNRNFLHPDYLAMLARRGVAHVYNSWAGMPYVSEQLAIPETMTNPALSAARFQLKPGRKFQEAVDLFSPYDRLLEPYEEARAAAAILIQRVIADKKLRKLFLYVSNRLEGNALQSILAILGRLEGV
jgi:uncharacterized protein YecE (DUF72 family)